MMHVHGVLQRMNHASFQGVLKPTCHGILLLMEAGLERQWQYIAGWG